MKRRSTQLDRPARGWLNLRTEAKDDLRALARKLVVERGGRWPMGAVVEYLLQREKERNGDQGKS